MIEPNRFTYEPSTRPPPRVEIDYFDEQLRRFDFQAPDPTARSEARRRGWGFENHLRPPIDCWEFVVASLKKKCGARLTDRLLPGVKFSLLTTLTTYFAWLRTRAGTEWLLALYGIFIIPPHPGYAYFYQGERLVPPQFDLRIYEVDTSSRTAQTPADYGGPKLLEWLTTTLESRRGPSSKDDRDKPPPMPNDNIWRWVGETLRNWLMEKEPDREWPHRKPDRISGYVWAKEILRPGSQTDYVWAVLGKAEVYRDSRLYRIQNPAYEERLEGGVRKKVPPRNPGLLWVDRKDMRVVPLDDLDQHLRVAPQTIEARYRCKSCGQLRCCTTEKGSRDRLCMSCRATQLESGDRQSFLWCQYSECRNCPEYLRSPEDLINRISQLNYQSGRVQRP